MTDNQQQNGAEEWDNLLHHLRQIREQVREQGPLPDHEKEEVADAFRRGLALLENQVRDIEGEIKGSSGQW
ncbi:hypothetical protein [Hymenobacter sp. AT01-02]|uniref:hypothetical protein n=1 Tax=Hymenobacter sp. AT01-02 TaxID=1571877 RepID=UPI0005F16F60|nr:hypothetical protein [Hymenobacter sp. AT01-02]